jgi:hypothetical protein
MVHPIGTESIDSFSETIQMHYGMAKNTLDQSWHAIRILNSCVKIKIQCSTKLLL